MPEKALDIVRRGSLAPGARLVKTDSEVTRPGFKELLDCFTNKVGLPFALAARRCVRTTCG